MRKLVKDIVIKTARLRTHTLRSELVHEISSQLLQQPHLRRMGCKLVRKLVKDIVITTARHRTGRLRSELVRELSKLLTFIATATLRTHRLQVGAQTN